jgi:flagellar basal body-associated protein FliL
MTPQPTHQSQNNVLVFMVVALFMLTIALTAVFYFSSKDRLDTIRQNQQNGQQSSSVQRQDLTKITCSMWHTMITSPNAHPSDETRKQMVALCG